jgi:hypothetical protein
MLKVHGNEYEEKVNESIPKIAIFLRMDFMKLRQFTLHTHALDTYIASSLLEYNVRVSRPTEDLPLPW